MYLYFFFVHEYLSKDDEKQLNLYVTKKKSNFNMCLIKYKKILEIFFSLSFKNFARLYFSYLNYNCFKLNFNMI